MKIHRLAAVAGLAFGAIKMGAWGLSRWSNESTCKDALYSAILENSGADVAAFYRESGRYETCLRAVRCLGQWCTFGLWNPASELPDRLPVLSSRMRLRITGVTHHQKQQQQQQQQQQQINDTRLLLLSAAVMNKPGAAESILIHSPECKDLKRPEWRSVLRIPDYLSLSAFAHRTED